MKMLFIIYDADFDEDVMGTLEACSITAYTKWDQVMGKGNTSEPKLDDSVWPGFNIAVFVVVEDDVGDRLFNAMERLSRDLGGIGCKVFELPVLRVI